MTGKIFASTLHYDESYASLPLLYLKTCVENSKKLQGSWTVNCESFSVDTPTEKIIEKIKKTSPEVVAFSCFIWNVDRILSLCEILKDKLPGVRVVLGGVYVTPLAEQILNENPAVDVVVRGEGERTFPVLLEAFSPQEDVSLDDVRGITFERNGDVVANPSRSPVEDLDEVPTPYVESNSNLFENRVVTVESQRGCRNRCLYCYFTQEYEQVRQFSLDRVKSDLAFVLNEKVEKIFLSAPNFNSDLERAKKICRFIAEHNEANKQIWTDLRAEWVDEELAELMAAANFHVQVGLQSKFPGVVEKVNRSLDLSEFENGYSLLKEKGVYILLNLILGLPGSTFKKFEESLKYVLRLEPEDIWVFHLMVLPGTKLWHQGEEFGLEYRSDPPHTVVKTETMSRAEMLEVYRLSRAVMFVYKYVESVNQVDRIYGQAVDWVERSELFEPDSFQRLRELGAVELSADYQDKFGGQISFADDSVG